MTIIDLTHSVGHDMPHWPGDPRTKLEKAASIEKDGFFLQKLEIGEHSGTHLGTAAHLVNNGRTMDRVPVEHLVLKFRDFSDHFAFLSMIFVTSIVDIWKTLHWSSYYDTTNHFVQAKFCSLCFSAFDIFVKSITDEPGVGAKRENACSCYRALSIEII